MWSVCTELLRCMHGACITCTAMHATVRVRKFVVNKISNGPGDDFLRAPIQIMTPSNRSHPTPTSRRQGSMLPGSQARRAERERSSSVQTDLTGQITCVYSPPRGRGRWTERSRGEKWRTRKRSSVFARWGKPLQLFLPVELTPLEANF